MQFEQLTVEPSTPPFPIYDDPIRELLRAHATETIDRDPAVAHILAVLSGYAYADTATVAMMASRLGMEGSTCLRIAQTVDAMTIFSTAYLLQSRCGRVPDENALGIVRFAAPRGFRGPVRRDQPAANRMPNDPNFMLNDPTWRLNDPDDMLQHPIWMLSDPDRTPATPARGSDRRAGSGRLTGPAAARRRAFLRSNVFLYGSCA